MIKNQYLHTSCDHYHSVTIDRVLQIFNIDVDRKNYIIVFTQQFLSVPFLSLSQQLSACGGFSYAFNNNLSVNDTADVNALSARSL